MTKRPPTSKLVATLREADRMVDRAMRRLGGNGRATPTDVSVARQILRSEQARIRDVLEECEGL